MDDDTTTSGPGVPDRSTASDGGVAPRAGVLGEQWFRTLFGRAPIGIALVATRERRILDANAEYARIIGRTVEDTRGLDWAEFTHPDDLELSLHNVDKWLAESSRDSAVVLKRYLRPDGSVVLVSLNSAAVDTDASGERLHLSMIEDVTERTRAAELLQDSERRYRLLADHAGDVVLLFRDGRIEWAAPSITALLGYQPEELAERLALDLVHPDDRQSVLTHRARLLAGQPIRVRARFRHLDGRWIWIEYTSRPLQDDDGLPTGAAVTTLWNIQAEVEAREALAIAEADRLAMEASMQRATRLEGLGVLAGGVAHDFNNILAGILGNTELALEQLPADSPLRPLLQNVATSAVRASGLTRQLLDYAGHRRFDHLGPTDPIPVIRETMELVATLLPRGAEVTIDLPDRLPAVECDGGQLQQVVMNLVINAADALESQRGHITVRALQQHLDEVAVARLSPAEPRTPGAFVEISVTDDGVGMDAEVAGRVFEPFFTTKADGRGLGLAAVYGIARSCVGMVGIESEPGRGTTVRVHLPVVTADTDARSMLAIDIPRPSADDHDDRPADGPGRTTTVLVVDDDEHVREVCVLMLEVAGCVVVACADGPAAVDAVTADPTGFDVALLDMSMPGMGGEDVLRAIREIAPSLPAVLMSGFSAVNLHEVIDDLEIEGFVQKPFRPAALAAAIRAAVRAR